MRKFATLFLIFFAVFLPLASSAETSDRIFPDTNAPAPKPLQALLYVMATKRGMASLRKNIHSMDIVAPQTYTFSQYGALYGKPKQEILDIASSANASVMPLVSNQDFNQKLVHAFLHDPVSQGRLVEKLIAEAREKKYIGYQYDLEHIPYYDRDAYSDFIRKSVPAFHMAGLKISVALAPLHSDKPSEYGEGSWQNWTGAFDYVAIGSVADFVSVMAYDDSKSKGPTASLPWVNEVAAYALARIPSEKISLGIPFYAWVRNANTGVRESIVTYPVLTSFIESNHIDKGWSEELGVPWVKYRAGSGKNMVAWYEDSRSFEKKIEMIKRTKMLGFSAWALGQEDPKIWDSIVAFREGVDQVAMR